jgi:hypothetical protein
MWHWITQLFHDLWFYGWPYAIILLEVYFAIYFANYFFYGRNGHHKKRNPMDMEFREDTDKKDLPPVP